MMRKIPFLKKNLAFRFFFDKKAIILQGVSLILQCIEMM